MSTSMQGIGLWAAPAGQDLSASIFKFAKINTADGSYLLAGLGQLVFGVITEGAILGKPATVQYSDIAKITLGAALTAGVRVMSDASGNAVASNTSPPGSREAGTLLKGGNAGEVVTIQLNGGNKA